MSVIVTDTGFAADNLTNGFCDLGTVANDVSALDIPSDINPDDIPLSPRLQVIRVDFPSSGDGRGFTIARQLRLRGFGGRLRARGHVISDQYAMARRAGFDEIEISNELAARQPEADWLFRANWQEHDYQSRLRG
jgi:uncharacterized protein (DUF934 family)